MDSQEVCTCQRPLVTVDVALFSLQGDALQVLLVRRRRWPCKGMWTIPGGLVSPEESLEDAALRKLEEETGMSNVYLEQLYTFGAPDRNPGERVITVSYYALAPAKDTVPLARTASSHVRWWSVQELPTLAFDHRDILSYALTRLRYKLEYTAIGFELLPDEFTLTELQSAYETVLAEELDKRNFRRKILGAGVIEPSGKVRPGAGRPARLYRYRQDAVAEIKARRLFP